MPEKTIAIIGGGMAGLTTAQSFKARDFAPIVFEKKKALGGIWNQESGNTWHGLETNISRYHMNFPNFPHAASASDFLTGGQIATSLNDFTTHFGLAPAYPL